MHWRRWEDLCQPKEVEGLNFRDLVNFNQAMLAKQAWKVLSNPQLTVSKVLRGRYFPTSSVLSVRMPSSSSSFFWKGFVWGMALLKSGIRKNLGNGKAIHIFHDPWLPRPTTFKVVSPLDTTLENALVADFITSSLQWNVEKLNQYLLRQDVEVIQCLPISSSAPDRWI